MTERESSKCESSHKRDVCAFFFLSVMTRFYMQHKSSATWWHVFLQINQGLMSECTACYELTNQDHSSSSDATVGFSYSLGSSWPSGSSDYIRRTATRNTKCLVSCALLCHVYKVTESCRQHHDGMNHIHGTWRHFFVHLASDLHTNLPMYGHFKES